MVYIPIPTACGVEIRCQCLSQRIENTLTFARDGGYGEDELEDIADRIGEWWYSYLRTLVRNTCTLTEVYARDLSDENGPTYVSVDRAGTTGDVSSGNSMPLNVTFAVSFRTTGRGRSYRGRNYMMALSSGQVAGNQVTTTYRNGVIAAYAALLPGGAFDLGVNIWCVGSRYHNNEPRDPGIAIPIIAVTATNDNLDSHRRRLTGRGD